MNIYNKNQDPREIGEKTQIILDFFERLENELPNVNVLQRGIWKSYERALEAFDKYTSIQSFKINA